MNQKNSKKAKSVLKLGLIFLLILGLFVFTGCSKSDMSSSSNMNLKSSLSGVEVTIYKSPNCGCCVGYIKELKKTGAIVTVISDDSKLDEMKTKLNVPANQRSCHSAVYEKSGYFVEGHVPFIAVEKILTEKPLIEGISLPGMPSGSTGMPGQKKGDFVISSINKGSVQEYMRI